MLMILSACNGVMDGIYDETPEAKEHEIIVDASDGNTWSRWHYISFAEGGKVDARDIPTAETEAFDSDGSGIYTYEFKVMGMGPDTPVLHSKYPTEKQQDPDEWDIAVHLGCVRTNGGAVYETDLTSLDAVANSAVYALMPFTEDEWSDSDVWVDKTRMTSRLIGCQRIKINKVLSKWLELDLPNMPPPIYIHKDNVYILRLKNGTYAALRLKSQQGFVLTIEYRYPL